MSSFKQPTRIRYVGTLRFVKKIDAAAIKRVNSISELEYENSDETDRLYGLPPRGHCGWHVDRNGATMTWYETAPLETTPAELEAGLSPPLGDAIQWLIYLYAVVFDRNDYQCHGTLHWTSNLQGHEGCYDVRRDGTIVRVFRSDDAPSRSR